MSCPRVLIFSFLPNVTGTGTPGKASSDIHSLSPHSHHSPWIARVGLDKHRSGVRFHDFKSCCVFPLTAFSGPSLTSPCLGPNLLGLPSAPLLGSALFYLRACTPALSCLLHPLCLTIPFYSLVLGFHLRNEILSTCYVPDTVEELRIPVWREQNLSHRLCIPTGDTGMKQIVLK